MTEEEIKALTTRMTAFRERCCKKWGLLNGTAKFGSYAPAIVGDMLRGLSEEAIWNQMIAFTELVQQRVKEALSDD